MNFTDQQNEIFNSKEQITLVKAYAGSGKTTTLVEFAKRHLDKKILYIAFNSSVVENAKKKFPKNVTVSTLHGLAYKEFGAVYAEKLNRPLKISTILSFLELERNSYNIGLSKIIIETINNFNNSNYLKLTDAIPLKTKYNTNVIEELFTRVWLEMINNTNNFPITHDTYLKLFHLSDPVLNYDYILFDEAQDANPVIVDIILKQIRKINSKILVVGDNHQSIYSFKNAINSLNKFNHKKEYYLNKSFRFGDNIAKYVNSILKVLKGETIDLIGSDHEDFIVENFQKDEKFAIISRTNACLFLKAIQAIENNKKIHFISGFRKYNFYSVLDVDYLAQGKLNKINDLTIKDYGNYQNFVHEAEVTQDKELIFLKKIVDKYKGKIADIFKKIEESIVSEKEADIIFTTAHKAKGLQFDNVFLCNDFTSFIDNNGEMIVKNWSVEEINILYVASSRAIYKLKPNTMLKNVYNYYENCKNKKNVVKNIQDNKINKLENKLINKLILKDINKFESKI